MHKSIHDSPRCGASVFSLGSVRITVSGKRNLRKRIILAKAMIRDQLGMIESEELQAIARIRKISLPSTEDVSPISPHERIQRIVRKSLRLRSQLKILLHNVGHMR